SYKKNESGGKISFGRAFTIGILITLIGCVCYGIVWATLVHPLLLPDFVEKYTAYQVAEMQQAGKSAAEITAATNEMLNYKKLTETPLADALITSTEPLPVGILVTLVSSFILSRKKKTAT